MNINDFIKNYDFEGSIVLLEGKRKVKEADQDLLIQLGKILATKTQNIIFRSGNAPGADELFCQGVSLVDSSRIQLILPNKDHRKKARIGTDIISLDDVNLLNEPEVVYQSKSNKKVKNIVERYADGHRDALAIKASYIIRDTVKVLGLNNLSPASFGIFYDDLDDPQKGGTGHTMSVCLTNNVSFVDQKVWMNWLRPLIVVVFWFNLFLMG